MSGIIVDELTEGMENGITDYEKVFKNSLKANL